MQELKEKSTENRLVKRAYWKETWRVTGSVVNILESMLIARMDEDSIRRGTMESWKVMTVENRLEKRIWLRYNK